MAEGTVSGPNPQAPVLSPTAPPMLRTEGLCKRFGGVIAADSIELRCPIRRVPLHHRTERRRQIDALHARSAVFTGRTLDASFFKNVDITGLTAFRRVRLGVGLTFQTNRAFHALTVAENLDAAQRRPSGTRG